MEYLDIVDAKGNPTGETVEREYAHRHGIRHRTSHVWILRKRDEIEILLQKRSLNKDSYPGCYDISSAGHIPAGSDYKISALRELKEELGIAASISQLHYIGTSYSDSFHIFHEQPFHNVQVSRVYILWYDGPMTLQKEEVENVKWMLFRLCQQAVLENQMPHCIKKEELEMIENYLEEEKYESISQ